MTGMDALSQIAIDMVMGSIPVVGDVVELGEFIYALRTGKDKYDQKVDGAQLALMGVGALPFVSKGMLKAAKGLSSP